MRRPLWIPWRWWRRAAQFALLLLFLWLFRRTEYTGADELAGGENLFFRLDPLAGAAAMIAARQFIAAFWPAAIVVALTLIFGRFFCGWVCPLGTLLDYFHRLLRPIARRTNRLIESRGLSRLSRRGGPCHPNVFDRRENGTVPLELQKGDRSMFSADRLSAKYVCSPKNGPVPNQGPAAAGRATKYVLLLTVLAAAVFAFPLVGLVDPFSLLLRGLAFWIDPMLSRSAEAGFAWTGGRWGIGAIEPFIKTHMLPYGPTVFQWAGLSAAILTTIFALEFVARRFWCRYLCPAGALLGLLGRRSLLRRVPVKVCNSCGRCATMCRMDALDTAGGLSPEACNLCMDCIDFCPQGIVKFAWKRPKGRPRPVDLSRRSALVGIVAGAAIPGVVAAARLVRPTSVDPRLLRPPGTADEKTFLNLCIRCGECMKVCPTNALQPAVLEAGIEGIFSPRLVPRFHIEPSIGEYKNCCEYACTQCGQVCPAGAIPRLSEEEKHKHPTGKAYFDHSLCLPWAEKTPCIRCEEMCPAPEKAIKILHTLTIKGKDGEDVEIQQPYVDRDLCVGCGNCESKCTLDGPPGIRVLRVDAPDPKTETLLNRKP